MNRTKVAVALGMITTPVSFVPIFDLIVAHCISAESCSEQLNVRLPGAVLASCVVGLIVAWAADRLLGMMASRRQQDRRNREA